MLSSPYLREWKQSHCMRLRYLALIAGLASYLLSHVLEHTSHTRTRHSDSTPALGFVLRSLCHRWPPGTQQASAQLLLQLQDQQGSVNGL